MTPDAWREIERLVHEALSLDPSARTAFTGRITDARIRAEVESLLAADSAENDSEIRAIIGEAAQGYSPAPSSRLATMGAAPSTAGARSWPRAIGRYRILSLLGEGGMGVVYEAEQELPRRKVALKVIKTVWAGPELLRRFEQESQALGRLQHPGIAQVYEAGSADTGFGFQPFFAMELIHGKPLPEYADEHRLNTRQRLTLMIQVCEAVQHAHQRGIIHRDLKPGNILVDESSQPKILDFGLARITDSDAHATRQTDMGQLLGTLAYMSPEQVLADPLAVDTRSDVYALGVILYELLSGKLPYDLTKQLHEAVQTIQQQDPSPLSTVSRIYRGDIETIVAKALEKDRARRYASAADLAADIRRHLDDRPITAQPASAAYQLQKFARRHKALVGATATVLAVLLGGIIASTMEAARARSAEKSAVAARQAATRDRDHAVSAESQAVQERNRAITAEKQAEQDRNTAIGEKQRADTAAATAAAVNTFLQNDLLAQASNETQAGPDSKPDPNLTVRAALDKAAARIQGKFAGQPLVEASIRETIGRTYADLGLYAEAERHAQRAFDLRRRSLGPQHPDTLSAQVSLAKWLTMDYKYAQAEPHLLEALPIEQRLFGENDRRTLESVAILGSVYVRQGKYTQAEAVLTRALEKARRALGNDDRTTLEMLTPFAIALDRQNKWVQAEKVELDELEASRRVYGPEHPSTVGTMHSLALIYTHLKQFVKAEQLFQQVIEIQGRVRGVDHPNRLATMSALAGLYSDEGKYEEARKLFTTAIDTSRRVSGEEDPRTLIMMNNLAVAYLNWGKPAEAEPLLIRLVAARSRVSGEEHPETLTTKNNLAVAYGNQGKLELAEPLMSKVIETRRRVLGKDHPATLAALDTLATWYQQEGKLAEAEPLVLSLAEGRRRTLGAEHADTLGTLSSLGLLRIRMRRFGEAEAVLREALAGREKTILNEWRLYNSQALLGESLAGQGRYAEAEPLMLSGYAGLIERESAIPEVSRYNLVNAGTWIVELYANWGKAGEAAEWKRQIQARKK